MAMTLKYAFRITHLANIAYIEQNGIVRANSLFRDPNYISIGDKQVINSRASRTVKGYHLNEYIPFYFGPRSPMLYVIQNGYNGVTQVDAKDIVYCVIRLDEIVHNDVDCIFTDGHALSGLTSFYGKSMLSSIDQVVKFDDVYSSQWNLESDRDLKRRKEAELLVKRDLSPEYVKGYIVYNEPAKQQLLNIGIAMEKIFVKPGYYF